MLVAVHRVVHIFGGAAWDGGRSFACKLPVPEVVVDRAGRITRRSDYLRVHKLGRKHVGRFLLLFYLPAEGQVLRVGITVSSKVGGAVVRNRAKRRIREAVRAELGRAGKEGQGMSEGAGSAEGSGGFSLSGDIAFVALARIKDASYAEIKKDLASLFARVA